MGSAGNTRIIARTGPHVDQHPIDNPDEEAHLVRLRGGDRSALGDLFAHYRDRLWRAVHFRLDPRLAGRVDADDVVQEAYMAAEQRLDHYLQDTTRSFFIWLRLITVQTLIDVHRRHLGARIRDASLEVQLAGGQSPQVTTMSLAGRLLGSATSPSQAAMRAEVEEKIEEALASMDPIDREVLALRHFEELSNNEVSEVLGLQKSAASNRYVRALERLRKILAASPELFGDEA